MKYTIKVTEANRKKAESMNLQELLSYVCCPNYGAFNRERPFLDTATAFIHGGDSSFHKKMMKGLLEVCREKPFVCTDLEAGPGSMISDGTEFPSFYSCSVTGDTKLTYNMGKIAALEGRELGYNWTLGPAVDINANPDTPTTGTRGAGNSVDEVINHGLAYIKGCQKNGMIATAKHFPGDGFGIYDQHLTTPEIPLAIDEWRNTSGKVYKEMIDQGVMSIMPGHLSFPAYDEPWPENGEYPPATLSPKLMKDLLKGELGFDGLIMSDAVKMVGFSGFMNFYEACGCFLESGGDILLFAYPYDKFVAKMEEIITRGVLSMETLYDRTARILSFKEQIKRSFDKVPGRYDRKSHEKTALEVIGRSIGAMRDRKSILPVPNADKKKILHLILTIPNFGKTDLLRSFSEQLKQHFLSVDEWIDPGNGRILEAVENNVYDLIICSIGNDYNFGTNVVRFNGFQARNLMGGWVHMGTPILFICHYHPFTHLEYKASMDTVINTNGTVVNTLLILTGMICGIVQLNINHNEKSNRDWTLRGWLNENTN